MAAWSDEVLQYYTVANVGSSGSLVFNDKRELTVPLGLSY